MGIDGKRPIHSIVDEVVDMSIRAGAVDDLPHPGDADWPAYCQLFADVSAATKGTLKPDMLFSGRKQVADRLWVAGYRTPAR